MTTKIYVLHFPKETSDKPLISALVRQYDIDFNILKATILQGNDGLMVLEVTGHKENVKDALASLKAHGVKIETISTIIRRDEDQCFHCGACTGVCPVSALYLQRPEMFVLFDTEKCTGCGLCVAVCPVHAMTVGINEDIGLVC
jgi:NAD-dependent dihydropyrimidine dehydrogenase PreA subunit